MDKQLLKLRRLYQQNKAQQAENENQRVQFWGGVGNTQTINDSTSGNKPYIEKTLIDLKFSIPQIITIFIADGNKAGTIDSYRYFKCSFGSQNGLHECKLSPGIHVLFGDTIMVTAISARVPGSGKIQTWSDYYAFSAITEGATPGWTEE